MLSPLVRLYFSFTTVYNEKIQSSARRMKLQPASMDDQKLFLYQIFAHSKLYLLCCMRQLNLAFEEAANTFFYW